MAPAGFDSVLPRIVPFPIPDAIRNLVTRTLGIDEIARIYGILQSMGDRPIAERLLDLLSVRCAVTDADYMRIPQKGATILSANHPFGILDGAVLATLLGRIRSDVRILANSILTVAPELRDQVIPVDLMCGRDGTAGNANGLRRSLQHLKAGGMLVVFPAG